MLEAEQALGTMVHPHMPVCESTAGQSPGVGESGCSQRDSSYKKQKVKKARGEDAPCKEIFQQLVERF